MLSWILFIVLVVYEMSTQSCFVPDNEGLDTQRESASDTVRVATRSLRPRITTRRWDYEDYLAEQTSALFRSRAGYISNMTKIEGIIETLMSENGTYNDVVVKKNEYDQAWIKFVNAHEQYVKGIVLEREKENAFVSYEKQKMRKLCVDDKVKQWYTTFKLENAVDDIHANSLLDKPKDGKFSGTSASSKRSLISIKEENYVQAQLKVNQLRKQHEIDRKLSELTYEKEILKAQMEEEQARVSLIYEQHTVDKQGEAQLEPRDKELDLHSIDDVVTLGDRPNVNVYEPPIGLELPSLPKDHGGFSATLVNNPSIRAPIYTTTTLNPPIVSSIARTSHGPFLNRPWLNASFFHGRLPTPNVCSTQSVNRTLTQTPLVRTQASCGTGQYLEARPAFAKAVEDSQPRSDGLIEGQQQQQGPGWTVGTSQPVSQPLDNNKELVQIMRQVVSTPKIEYIHFDGNPVNYTSFMHNFETCLEKEIPDNSRRLQLLIQHCTGKAKEVVQSCVNLPIEEAYQIAKGTLFEHFGRPHIIAKAHIKTLEDIAPVKQGDGAQSLLEFVRGLEVADRTLLGMGSVYVEELNHVNTLKLLSRKLPVFLRIKWAERAGEIIESGERPKFGDFLQFVKRRATLVNNEFGEDLISSIREKSGSMKGKDSQVRVYQRYTSLAVGSREKRSTTTQFKCFMCSGLHRIWKCDKFKKLTYEEKRKFVQRNLLCFKCLCAGHYARECPKIEFKCRIEGCNKEHHTLLHPTSMITTVNKQNKGTNVTDEEIRSELQEGESRASKAATGAGVRVCLNVVPVCIQAKEKSGPIIKTYALLDSGSEVTLCHKNLQKRLGAVGKKLDFTLSGMIGSTVVKSEMIDVIITSIDGSFSIELSNVHTVNKMSIPQSCVAKKKDIVSWPHLQDIGLHDLNDVDIMLVIGLQERPDQFLPLEYKMASEKEPVAVRYSLGWTVIGPVGGVKKDIGCSSNFTYSSKATLAITANEIGHPNDLLAEPVVNKREREIVRQYENDKLNERLEGLWRTDFEGTLVNNKVCDSVEDKRALEVMESSLKVIDGHFQVALPWRKEPPYLPNNRVVAEKRVLLLKKRLINNHDLYSKYKKTMNDYLEQEHAKRISEEELHPKDKPVWYLPHHPVVHPLKPEKVRVVYDCAAKYRGTSLNQQLMQGPNYTNQLLGC